MYLSSREGVKEELYVATSFAIKTRIAINYCKTRCDDRNFITFDFTTSFAIKTRIAINSLYGPRYCIRGVVEGLVFVSEE